MIVPAPMKPMPATTCAPRRAISVKKCIFRYRYWLVIVVSDDGVGMTEETCANITQVESSTGLGIAVKNVHDRMIGFFGPDAQMVYTSVLGEGTQVTLRCPGCAKAPASAVASAEALAASLDEVAGEAAESAEKAARNNATMAELTELVAQVSE